ncbi:MAG: NYN domain-containing protein [Bacteroidetes bacterium]|nr:MAG: NYN domain-containing protein [Bacteroidota bacterium]
MDEALKDAQRPRIAVLIDGDNARPSLIGKYLSEAGKYGIVTLRRIYGDWTTPQMNGWKESLNHHAVQPIQQFRYTVGKNATDSALIIDAMDILLGKLVDAFCLVSSDSDYTRLATRIRESGIFVMGIGEHKTPKPFVNACNAFIFAENLLPSERRRSKSNGPRKPDSPAKEEARPDPLPILIEALELASNDDGWARLSTIGDQLRNLDPSFDPRTFGYKQLSQLVRAHKAQFEVSYQKKKGPTAIYVRLREEGK